MNTGRQSLAGCGTNTAALAFGGSPSGAVTELWNGTNWTAVNNLNTAMSELAGIGTQTAALAFLSANTETWNGTNWTATTVLNTPRGDLAGSGTNTVGLAFGGQPSGASTEEWNDPGTITKTITTS